MPGKVKVTIAVCLLLVVAYIFVLPAFDIDPTALRAARNADLLFFAIAAAASALTLLRPRLGIFLLSPDFAHSSVSSNLIDLTCTRLC